MFDLRRRLARRLPEYGFFDGLAASLSLLVLWLFAAPPRAGRDRSPPDVQRIHSVGPDGVRSELLIASRSAVAPGRYLGSFDNRCWHWVRVIACNGEWRHEVLSQRSGRRDVPSELALVLCGVAAVTTFGLVVLSHFSV